MATTIGEMQVRIGADTSGFDRGINQVERGMNGVSAQSVAWGNLISQGVSMGTTALVGLGKSALTAAIDIDSSMRNTQAVTGQSNAEIMALRDQVIGLSNDFTATPREAAAAYYDIAGGVTDATARMDVLRASMTLADAGQAQLTTTTQGLISAVNSYGAAILPASRASDVYTRSVGMGVGTMEQFVAAMGPMAGLAATAKVSFDELGAAIAYQTTQGSSASQSATRLRGVLTQLLKPNQDLAAALRAAGYESGEMALQQLGLAGTVNVVNDALGGSTSALSAAFGDVEAIQGAIALTNENYQEFATTFNAGLDGSTLSSLEQQSKSAAFQMEILKGQLEGVGVSAGNVALPVLTEGLMQGSWIIDAIFPTPQQVQEEATLALGALPASLGSVEYQIKPGDTAEDIAAATGATIDEVNRALREQGGYVSVGVDPSLDTFAAKMGKSREEAQAIAETMGWNVQVPLEVTADMVIAEATKRGLDPNQPGVFEDIRKELENNAAGGVSVDIPTNINVSQAAMQFADASGMSYTDAQTFINGLISGRDYTARLNVGATVELRPTGGDGQPFDLKTAYADYAAAHNETATPVEISATDSRLALAVSAYVGVAEFLVGDLDEVAIFTAVQDAVDLLPPINIDLKDVYLDAAKFTLNPGSIGDDIGRAFMDITGLGPSESSGNYDTAARPTVGRPDGSAPRRMPRGNPEDMMSAVDPGFFNNGGQSDLALTPAQAFINAVLSEDTTEGMRGLVDEGVVNATANFDMAQPDQEFKSITDWMNQQHDIFINAHVTTYGAGPRGEGINESMAAAGAYAGNIPEFASGGGTGDGGLAMLHSNEYVVPSGGILVKPSGDGLAMMGGGSGGGGGLAITGGTFNFYGVQNTEQLFNELQTYTRQRGS